MIVFATVARWASVVGTCRNQISWGQRITAADMMENQIMS
jgi:hypothetical protein